MKTDGLWPFNRCFRCGGLITKLEILKAFKSDGVTCACGGGMFRPSNLKWFEYSYPKVWLVYIMHFLGKLTPSPDAAPLPIDPELREAKPIRVVESLTEGTVFEEEDE